MARRRSVVLLGLGALAALGVAAVGLTEETETGGTFRTAKIERGDILKSVSASGELGAVVTVKVGSEISGQISELLADFNSEVRAGEVIARIDPESLEARVNQVKAELAVARAAVDIRSAALAQARANLLNAEARLDGEAANLRRSKVTAADLERDYKRKQELRKRGVIPVSTADRARAAWEAAVQQVTAAEAQQRAHQSTISARAAQVEMAEAEVVHARAQVQQKEAALEVAEVNLDNTFIRSPVDGVVIGRDVDVGQTVAASLQAPTLFTIAQDLRKMQVETNIDEADIGQVRAGQPATFTVDAFPGREFRGSVTQIRKQPKNVQNVVTYTVLLSADNADLRLLPGMTANVEIKVSNRPGVLRIPNAALRFTPPGASAAAAPARAGVRGGEAARAQRRAQAEARLERLASNLGLAEEQKSRVREISQASFRRIVSLRRNGIRGEEFRRSARQLREQSSKEIMAILDPGQRTKYAAILAERRANPVRRGRVWVLENGAPKLVSVRIGVGDGKFTELAGGGLAEGREVLVGLAAPGKQQASRFWRFGF